VRFSSSYIDGNPSRNTPPRFVLERAAPGLEVTTLPGVDLTRSGGAVRHRPGPGRRGAARGRYWTTRGPGRRAAVTFAADALGAAPLVRGISAGPTRSSGRRFGVGVIGSFQAIKHKVRPGVSFQLEVHGRVRVGRGPGPGRPARPEALAAAAAAVTVVEAAMDLALDCLTAVRRHRVHLGARCPPVLAAVHRADAAPGGHRHLGPPSWGPLRSGPSATSGRTSTRTPRSVYP